MKNGVLIDPASKEVTPVQYGSGDIPSLLGCDRFTVAYFQNRDAVVFVDDDGLNNGPTSFFLIDGIPQPLAGRGLVADSDLTADQVREITDFGEPVRMGPMLMFVGEANIRQIQ